ncbi:MAG: phosphotransferase, partial [Spongiibacteraceae bacterium]|nr:phosphotransferase [Spongiibacteraceae bacterium]
MELEQWVNKTLGSEQVALRALSGDAGFRRYFRTEVAGRRLIVMDAAADHGSCAPFARMARLLEAGGLHVPHVEAWQEERGWMILSDLGEQTFLDVLNSDNADALFGAAIDALVRLQQQPAPADLPRYDAALLRRELDLFPAWYLERHLGMTIDASLAALLDALFDTLVTQALQQPQVLVHRDYMPRNLMVSEPNPGVLDFQ